MPLFAAKAVAPRAAEFNRPTLCEELALQRDRRRHCKALRKVWQGEASWYSLGGAFACLVRWLRSESHTKPEGRRPVNARVHCCWCCRLWQGFAYVEFAKAKATGEFVVAGNVVQSKSSCLNTTAIMPPCRA